MRQKEKDLSCHHLLGVSLALQLQSHENKHRTSVYTMKMRQDNILWM